MRTKILVIDDEKEICQTIKEFLEDTGEFRIYSETIGDKAIAAVKETRPHLIVLDIMLPGMNGFEICKSLKEKEALAEIPIIMLSARRDEPDRVAGLDMGADDYLPKPFSLAELRARIRAVLRRHYLKQKKRIVVGDIAIDRERHEVIVGRETVPLTPVEFKILEALASREGFTFSRDMLLEYIWEGEKCVVDRTIDVHIKHLRNKLGRAGKFIKNIRSIGYKLEI